MQDSLQEKIILLRQNQIVRNIQHLEDQIIKLTVHPKNRVTRVILHRQGQAVKVTLHRQDLVVKATLHRQGLVQAVHLLVDLQVDHQEEEDNFEAKIVNGKFKI